MKPRCHFNFNGVLRPGATLVTLYVDINSSRSQASYCAEMSDSCFAFAVLYCCSCSSIITICFTICLFISPDLDGHRAPKNDDFNTTGARPLPSLRFRSTPRPPGCFLPRSDVERLLPNNQPVLAAFKPLHVLFRLVATRFFEKIICTKLRTSNFYLKFYLLYE